MKKQVNFWIGMGLLLEMSFRAVISTMTLFSLDKFANFSQASIFPKTGILLGSIVWIFMPLFYNYYFKNKRTERR